MTPTGRVESKSMLFFGGGIIGLGCLRILKFFSGLSLYSELVAKHEAIFGLMDSLVNNLLGLNDCFLFTWSV